MPSFSPNMLKTFQTCPQKYKLKYIDGISVPQKASYFEKGKKIHALANYYLRSDDVSKLETVLTPEEQKLWTSLKNNEYFQKQYVNSEYNLSCKIGEFWIGGRLDAIVKDQSTFYILDYKTGSIPKDPEYDFQTMVYLLCLNKKLPENARIAFVYIDLKNNLNHLIELTPEKIRQYENLISKTCDQIQNFQPPEEIEPSKKCDFCEYKCVYCDFYGANGSFL